MVEERGSYHLEGDDPDRAVGGIDPIGDILRKLIDTRGWPLAVGYTPANGDSPCVHDDSSYPDV